MIIKNTVLVILNPRLKTLDTILPLLMELDQKKVELLIFSPDILTSNEIKKNFVINDCIKKIAKIVYIYKDYPYNLKNFIFNKIKIFNLCFKVFLKLIFNKIDFIYFSELKGKKKFLTFFRYNVFLCENDAYGHTKSIEWTKKLEREKLLGQKIKSGSFILPKQNLILFTDQYYNLNANRNNKKVNFWSYTNLKLSKNWLNYITENKDFY